MKLKLLPPSAVKAYTDAVSRFGPNSSQAAEVYALNEGIEGFPEFAEAFRDLKSVVKGAGISFVFMDSPKAESTKINPAAVQQPNNHPTETVGAHG